MLVPGSTFGLSHPFAWYALVRDKRTGREFTYWMNGSQITRELVAGHIATHFPGVELLKCDPCTAPPTRPLRPVPPEHYEFGIRKRVEAELNGVPRGGSGARRPIRRTPIL
jgi:hypothetical protein